MHKDYISPYSIDYYVKLSEEYFPLRVGNYWMYHVEPVTQDLWEYDPKKLKITDRKTVTHDGEQAEVYLLTSEDDKLIKLWVELLGADGDDQISLSDNSPAYNSFVRKGGTVYLGKYDGQLELGPVVFNPESFVLRMFGGEGSLSYLHEKDFEDIRYAQRGERVSPKFPICQYKYLSDDLGDELHHETRAVFAKNMGLYEITSSSDALSGLILLQAKILDKPERIDEDNRSSRASIDGGNSVSTDDEPQSEEKGFSSKEEEQVGIDDKESVGDYRISLIRDNWLYLLGFIWIVALIAGLVKANVFSFKISKPAKIKSLKYFVGAAFILIVLFLWADFPGAPSKKEIKGTTNATLLVGEWVGFREGNTDYVVYRLDRNGSGSFDAVTRIGKIEDEKIKWKLSGNHLSLEFSNLSDLNSVWEIKDINSDELTIINEANGVNVLHKKHASNHKLLERLSSYERKQKVEKKSYSCFPPTSTSGAKSCSQGTWISTPRGSLWLRIEIQGNYYKMYQAIPSKGDWGDVYDQGSCEFGSSRFSDTGQKYFFAKINRARTKGFPDMRIIFLDDGRSVVDWGASKHLIRKGNYDPWN